MLCDTGKNINYNHLQSHVGNYETDEGQMGSIEIYLGHSKQKRPDKKQFKMTIGTAEGVLSDAQFFSGHTDDKTWNKENLERVEVSECQ